MESEETSVEEQERIIEEGSSEVDEGSSEVDEGSLEVDEGSLEVDECSLEVDEGSSEVDEVGLGKLQELQFKLTGFAKDVINVLKDYYNTDEESNRNGTSSIYFSNIVRAIVTLSYTFRFNYRRMYRNCQEQFHYKAKYTEFCQSAVRIKKNKLYFFSFLQSISLIFEIGMYLHRDGYDYFHVAALSLAGNTDLKYFESAGGFPKLEQIARFLLKISADLQPLVTNEHPQTETLLTFRESLLQLQEKYSTSSDTKVLDSLCLLKAINKDFYSRLDRYSKRHVLAFLIIRFHLDGNPRPFIPPKLVGEESLYGLDDAEIAILMYLSKCMVPEITSGFAYEGQRIHSAEQSTEETDSPEPGASVCEKACSEFSHSPDLFEEEKNDFFECLLNMTSIHQWVRNILSVTVRKMKGMKEYEKQRVYDILGDLPEKDEFDWLRVIELVPKDSKERDETVIRLVNSAPSSAGEETLEYLDLLSKLLIIWSGVKSPPTDESTTSFWSEGEKLMMIKLIITSPESPAREKAELICMIGGFSESDVEGPRHHYAYKPLEEETAQVAEPWYPPETHPSSEHSVIDYKAGCFSSFPVVKKDSSTRESPQQSAATTTEPESDLLIGDRGPQADPSSEPAEEGAAQKKQKKKRRGAHPKKK